jgi:hypothetical protein
MFETSTFEIDELAPVIWRFGAERDLAISNYHQIPHIPLMMQHADWPVCCNDWCEFTGNPTDYDASVQVPSSHQFWELGPARLGFDFELQPESLSEVCIFRCFKCERSYFIWQPT